MQMQRKSSSSGGGGSWDIVKSFVRRKQVDSIHDAARKPGHQQLSRRLSVFDLTTIGIGATIGAGVYILVGTVAREQAGPALTISFLIAGIAAALSAFCYAELACRCPSAGSAYHYTYICIGESFAWIIGWALMLEYTIGSSAVARGLTPNLASYFGGEDKLPALLARHTIPGLGIVVDPCAAVLVLIFTVLLCLGIKESSLVQSIVTSVNIFAMLFIIIAGGYLGFKTGWVGYELPTGYFPFGVNGMLAGSGVVFFSYIGFDSVTSTAEEVKNPQRDLPLGIGIALSICCILYMLVSTVIIGLVPYSELDPDTPISTAFSTYGMHWAGYILTTGAVTALCASLMGSILPQPRILMAMARDGLLPLFFADINKRTQVPVKGTIATGILAALLALLMDVSQLAGMVSVGTLLAFTTAAVSVLILRYVTPNEVPLPPTLQEYFNNSASQQLSNDYEGMSEKNCEDTIDSCADAQLLLDSRRETSIISPLIEKHRTQDEHKQNKRRQIAAWNIILVCVGALVLALAASIQGLPRSLRFAFCAAGAAIFVCSLTILTCLDQDEARHSFGHEGGFICPLVPFLPVACILINTYLLINLGIGTWIRVSIWLLIGALIYVFYGRSRSCLVSAVYVSTACADEIYRSSNHLV